MVINLSNYFCLLALLFVVDGIKLTTPSTLVFEEFHGDQINVSLANSNATVLNSEVYGAYKIQTARSYLAISLVDIPRSVSFIIVQTHSYEYSVTLSYKTTIENGFHMNGTNLGLVYDGSSSIFTAYLFNFYYDTDVEVYLSIHAYKGEAPIPGGCNMEFPVPVSPFMQLQYDSALITVDGAPAKSPKLSCDQSLVNVTYDFFHYYMTERDYSSQEYFDSIKSMLTFEKVTENGLKVPLYWGYAPLRRSFSLYPGTGSVYVIIATSGNTSAVYVPTHTYGCSPIQNSDTCEVLTTTFSKLVSAIILFLGLFACYFGHRFFKTEMFLLGLMFGSLITYIVISIIAEVDTQGLIVASLLSGLCFGAIWWIFWWFYGIPIFSVILATLVLGYLIAATVFYWLPDGNILFESDINYWCIFLCILVMVPLVFLTATYHANLISCAVLGAYAVIIPIDHYIGSNLKYIVVNTVRRATVERFSQAVIDPPFQWRDAILSIIWALLALTGYYIQKRLNRDKPPFPPPPRSASLSNRRPSGAYRVNPAARIAASLPAQSSFGERSPLLSEGGGALYGFSNPDLRATQISVAQWGP